MKTGVAGKKRLINLNGAAYGRRSYGAGGKQQLNLVHNALCDLYEKVDKVIGGKHHGDLMVTPVDDKMLPAPSATDGQTIMISEQALSKAANQGGVSMMTAFGLNFHELAHVLYTPAFNSGTRHWIEQRPARKAASNILEDQRIEHMLRQEYPKMSLYFLAAVYEYFFSGSKRDFEKNFFAYAALAERRYVPRPERRLAREVMVKQLGEADTQKVEAICAEYVRYVQITSADFYNQRQQDLINSLADLMEKHLPPSQNPMQILVLCQDHSTEEHNAGKKGAPYGDVVPYEEIDGDDGVPMSEGDEGLEGEEEGAGAGGDGDGEDDGDEGTAASGKSRPKPRQQDGASGGKDTGPQDKHDLTAGNKQVKKVAQKPAGAYGRGPGRVILDVLSKELGTNVEVKRDLSMAERAITNAEFRLQPLPSELHTTKPIEHWMRQARDTFALELQKLQSQVDPGWDFENPSGRLNVRRVMASESSDNLPDPGIMFDEWIEDNSDALSIEAKILCDFSSSMSGQQMALASQSLWVVCSALDQLDAKIDPIAFNERCFQIWAQGRKQAKNTYELLRANGGTNPRVGVAKSRYDFADSKHTHKLFIIYSDGSWNAAHDEADIRAMKEMGVTTVMVMIGHGYGSEGSDRSAYGHDCEHFFSVTSAKDIHKIAKTITLAMLNTSVASLHR